MSSNISNFKMKSFREGKIFCIPAVIIFLLFIFPACRKHNPTSAVIAVTDSTTGLPVAGALVRLNQDGIVSPYTGTPASKPDPDTGITDNDGKVTFTIKWVANYYAQITRSPSPDTLNVLVRFEEEKTVEIPVKF